MMKPTFTTTVILLLFFSTSLIGQINTVQKIIVIFSNIHLTTAQTFPSNTNQISLLPFQSTNQSTRQAANQSLAKLVAAEIISVPQVNGLLEPTKIFINSEITTSSENMPSYSFLKNQDVSQEAKYWARKGKNKEIVGGILTAIGGICTLVSFVVTGKHPYFGAFGLLASQTLLIPGIILLSSAWANKKKAIYIYNQAVPALAGNSTGIGLHFGF